MTSFAPIPLATKAGTARSKRVSMERIRNLYPEPAPEGGKGAVTLYPTPGLSPWATVGDGPIRGMIRMGDDVYAVSGSELYVIDSSAVSTFLGHISGSGNVQMTQNGTHVAVVSSVNAYAASRSSFAEITDGTDPYNGFTDATYQDGYGVFTLADSQSWYITNLDDMTTITSTDFTSADALTGNVVGAISDHRELWIFGESFTEIYQNTGNASFPFERATMIERGCQAVGSIAKAENTVFWLADDGTVRAARGYEPQIISTTQVEGLIDGATSRTSARSFVYHQSGHTFYVLSFYDLTVVYDINTGLWHERVSTGMDRWRVGSYAFFTGKHLVGDVINGQVYSLDLDTYDDDGDAIIREMRLPPLNGQGRRVFVDELYLDFDGGTGLATGQGSDPQAMLDWTTDGGHSWSNELWETIGAVGEYGRRVTWRRLGAEYERTFRIRVSDPVKTVIKGAYLRASAGSQ